MDFAADDLLKALAILAGAFVFLNLIVFIRHLNRRHG